MVPDINTDSITNQLDIVIRLNNVDFIVLGPTICRGVANVGIRSIVSLRNVSGDYSERVPSGLRILVGTVGRINDNRLVIIWVNSQRNNGVTVWSINA